MIQRVNSLGIVVDIFVDGIGSFWISAVSQESINSMPASSSMSILSNWIEHDGNFVSTAELSRIIGSAATENRTRYLHEKVQWTCQDLVAHLLALQSMLMAVVLARWTHLLRFLPYRPYQHLSTASSRWLIRSLLVASWAPMSWRRLKIGRNLIK